tara:strand:- start:5772 stop:5924 length:153 start_codon:yes stop_codon:yes gene_type:complete
MTNETKTYCIREWNKDGFSNYISSRFDVIEHLEFDENTQCIVCKLKKNKD